MRLRWDWIAGGSVSAALLAVIIVHDDITTRKRVADTKAAEWAAEVAAARMPIVSRPWLNPECGVLKRDRRECDRRYWPGQVYPDEPIPGEKTPGIVWTCRMMPNPDPRLPAREVCDADVSPERAKAYPCPTMRVGNRQSSDQFCKAS